MFLSKKSLSRRAVLRGAGSCIALPLLDAMLPAQTKTPTAPVRLLCLEMVHGAAGSTPYGAANHLWSPAATGPNVEYSYALKPLEPLRDFVTIVSNTDARQGEAITPAEGGADHFRSSALFLTAAHAQQGPQVHNGVSIDQLYAQHIGNATRIPSLRLCIENIGLSGSCGFNYNCAYLDTISWASPTEPLSMEVNPRRVFEQLFGHSERGSVLDSTALASLRLQLGNEIGRAHV